MQGLTLMPYVWLHAMLRGLTFSSLSLKNWNSMKRSKTCGWVSVALSFTRYINFWKLIGTIGKRNCLTVDSRSIGCLFIIGYLFYIKYILILFIVHLKTTCFTSFVPSHLFAPTVTSLFGSYEQNILSLRTETNQIFVFWNKYLECINQRWRSNHLQVYCNCCFCSPWVNLIC